MKQKSLDEEGSKGFAPQKAFDEVKRLHGGTPPRLGHLCVGEQCAHPSEKLEPKPRWEREGAPQAARVKWLFLGGDQEMDCGFLGRRSGEGKGGVPKENGLRS